MTLKISIVVVVLTFGKVYKLVTLSVRT